MSLRKAKYYDISHLLKDYPDAYYYMAFGERSNGKSSTESNLHIFVGSVKMLRRRTSHRCLTRT